MKDPKPGGNVSFFTVRDATHQDIPAINSLFRGEYGEGYPYQMSELAHPDIHLVAIADGVIVGFARAAPYGVYSSVWELCSLVVREDAREHGIATAFTIARIDRLKDMGVKTLVSESVTCYPNCASQHNLIKFGFISYGILPFVHPWIRPEVLGEQPLSLVLMVLSINGGTGFGARELHLIDSDRSVLERLIPERDLVASGVDTVALKGMDQPFFKSGKLVHGIRGSDFVDISINHRTSIQTRIELQKQGYLFSALLPGFGVNADGHHYDLLRLYRPRSKKLTFDLVYVTQNLESLKRFCAREFNAS